MEAKILLLSNYLTKGDFGCIIEVENDFIRHPSDARWVLIDLGNDFILWATNDYWEIPKYDASKTVANHLSISLMPNAANRARSELAGHLVKNA